MNHENSFAVGRYENRSDLSQLVDSADAIGIDAPEPHCQRARREKRASQKAQRREGETQIRDP